MRAPEFWREDGVAARALTPLAWAYAASGDKKKSLQFLSKAVEKGFSDSAMITGNKAFDAIRNDPEYQQIIARLKSR